MSGEEKQGIMRRIATKLTSGRWIFTVTAALTFAVMAITGKMDDQSVKEIILLVAAFYFGQRAVETKPTDGE